jgi:hypothetical protein
MGDAFTAVHRAPIIAAAARNNVPAIYGGTDAVRDGGLLSYGVDVVDNFRRAASYVDRILRGERPGDLPVQFPTKFAWPPGRVPKRPRPSPLPMRATRCRQRQEEPHAQRQEQRGPRDHRWLGAPTRFQRAQCLCGTTESNGFQRAAQARSTA